MASVASKIEKIRNHGVYVEERLLALSMQSKFLYLAIENSGKTVDISKLLTDAETTVHPGFQHILPTKTRHDDGRDVWKACTLTDVCSYFKYFEFTAESVRTLSDKYERYVLEGQALIDVNRYGATDPSDVGRPEAFSRLHSEEVRTQTKAERQAQFDDINGGSVAKIGACLALIGGGLACPPLAFIGGQIIIGGAAKYGMDCWKEWKDSQDPPTAQPSSRK